MTDFGAHRRMLVGLTFTALAAAIPACGDGTTDGNAGEEVPLHHAEVDLRIGSVEGDGADVFGSVSGLELDPEGRIYVSDIQAHEIRVFHDDGGHAFTIGRHGSGPGELDSPCCLGFAPDGRLWVRDNGNARYVAFDVDADAAAPVATVRMNHGDANRHAATTFDAEGRLIDIGSRPDPSTGDVRTVLFHVGEDGEVEREVVAPGPQGPDELVHAVPVAVGEVQVTRYFHQPFGPRHVMAHGPGGSHADAVTSRYRVRWFSGDGTLVRTLSNPDAVGPPLTPEQRARGDSMIAADEATAGTSMPFGVPERRPVLASLHFDGSGHLWVERTAPPGERRLADVYDDQGELVRRVSLPAELQLMYGVLRPDVVLGVVSDELGVQYVVRLRVGEAP